VKPGRESSPTIANSHCTRVTSRIVSLGIVATFGEHPGSGRITRDFHEKAGPCQGSDELQRQVSEFGS